MKWQKQKSDSLGIEVCIKEKRPTILTDIDGKKAWYVDGVLHREDGPAIVHPNGKTNYWFRGEWISNGEMGMTPEKWAKLCKLKALW